MTPKQTAEIARNIDPKFIVYKTTDVKNEKNVKINTGIAITRSREKMEGITIENAFRASSVRVNRFAELLPNLRASI